jgi:hypothetical protein
MPEPHYVASLPGRSISRVSTRPGSLDSRAWRLSWRRTGLLPRTRNHGERVPPSHKAAVRRVNKRSSRMTATTQLAALIERERQTRIVVRCAADLVNDLQKAADRVGASKNQLAKALIREGLARLTAAEAA